MASQLPSSQEEKIEKISNLDGLRNNVHKAYEKFREVRLPGQELLRTVDTCDALSQSLLQQLDVQSSKEQSRNHDDGRSVRSGLSRRSGASRFSRTSSIIGLKKADVAAELAAKQAEFNALQEEAKYKEETAKIEAQLRAEATRIETELARRKLELEQLEVKKQIEIARAKLAAYQEVEDSEDDVNSVEDDLLRMPPIETKSASFSFPEPAQPIQPASIKHSATDVSASKPIQQTTQQSSRINQSLLQDENNQLHDQVYQRSSDFQDSTPRVDSTAAPIVTADSFSMSRLPVPEPTIFSGEPIQYPDWKSSFRALIDRKNLPSSDKMYYLKRYVSGSAKEAISGLFLQNSSEAYERAWKILDERFGHPFIITKAYRDRLQRWPKIGARDHQGLRKFADFLTSVEVATQVIQGLYVLNDYIENQKLLSKLPDWLISRWNRDAKKCLREEKTSPDFKTFVTFITALSSFLL